MTHEEDLLHKRLKRLLLKSETGEVRFKNYKEMCSVLKLPEKRSNSKKAQMKQLTYFINLQQGEKNELYYTEVCEDPDTQMLQTNKLILNMEQILLLTFLSSKYGAVEFLMNDYACWKLFGFINNKFSSKRIEKDFTKRTDVSNEQLQAFKEKTTGRFQDVLEAALKKMQDRAYIKCFPADIITLEDGREIEATSEQSQEVLNIENVIMKEMGYTSKKQIRYVGKTAKFYEKRLQRIQEMHPEWRHFSSGFRIILSDPKWLKRGLQRNLEEQKIYQIENNENIQELLRKSAVTTYENYLKKLEEECEPFLKFHPDKTINDYKEKTDIYLAKGRIMDENYLELYNQFLEEFVELQNSMTKK